MAASDSGGVRPGWWAVVVLVVVVGGIAVVPATSATTQSVTECGTLETRNTTYELAADVENATAEACIVIEASDVTVDGNGHTIDGMDAGGTAGVVVNATAALSNVTVTNLTVTGWDRGVVIDGEQQVALRSVTVSNNTGWNVYAADGAAIGATDLALGRPTGTTLSFDAEDVALGSVSSPPAEPASKHDVGRYVNATNTSANGWLDVDVEYADGDLPDWGNESDLRLWQHDGTGWSVVPGRNGPNESRNLVSANVTTFSILAPLGNNTITEPATIDESGNFTVGRNVTNGSVDTAISVAADDVSIDGAGHTINGTGSLATGIEVRDANNVFISDLRLVGIESVGIGFYDVTPGAITDSVIRGAKDGLGGRAISVGSSVNIVVRNNTISNVFNGVGISEGGTGSEFNEIRDNDITYDGSRNPRGIVVGGDSTVVANNTVRGVGSAIFNGRGISVEGGFDQLRNNTLVGNNRGIYLPATASQAIIADNDVTRGDGGIVLEGADANVVIRNRVANNTGTGIRIDTDLGPVEAKANDVGYNTVLNNSNGILLDDTLTAELVGNRIADNRLDFGVRGERIEHFEHAIPTNNTVDGKPIYYLVGASGTVIDESTNAGYVGVVNGEDVTVRNLTLRGNLEGVLFANTGNSRIANVTSVGHANGNADERGIYFFDSSNNTIADSRIAEVGADIDGVGVYLDSESRRNRLVNNTITNTTTYAVRAEGGYTTFVANNISTLGDGIYGSEGGNNTLRDNRITRTGTAIQLTNDNLLRNNTLTGNDDGINLDDGNELYGNNASNNDGTGIFVRDNNTLRNNTASKNSDPGGLFETGEGISVVSNNTLIDNAAVDNFEEGIDASDDNTIRNNTATGNGANIRLSGSGNRVLDNNASGGNRGVFLEFSDASDNRIEGNLVLGNRNVGIEINRGGHNRLVDNVVSRNGRGVFLSQGAHDNTITNTRVVNNSGMGVFVEEGDDNAVLGSDVSNNENTGIKVSGDIPFGEPPVGVGNVLENNTVVNNSGDAFTGEVPGVYLDGAIRATLSNNTIAGNDWSLWIDGSAIGQFAHAITTDNTVRGNPVYYLLDESDVVIDADADAGFVGVVNSSNVTVRGQTLSGNRPGLLLANADRATIRNVTATGNREYGIRVFESTNGTLVGNDASNVAGTTGGVGIQLTRSTNNTLGNNTAFGNDDAYVAEDARGNRVDRLAMGDRSDPTTVSFTLDTGTDSFGTPSVRLSAETRPPEDPSGYRNVGAHVDATASEAGAWIDLTIHYDESDASAVNESTLGLWRHDGTAWTTVANSTVNTSRNAVSANVTAFDVLAPLGESSTRCVDGVVAGEDDVIGLTEIQEAINWWAEGAIVPNTGGETISLSKIQALIDAWAEDATVSCA